MAVIHGRCRARARRAAQRSAFANGLRFLLGEAPKAPPDVKSPTLLPMLTVLLANLLPMLTGRARHPSRGPGGGPPGKRSNSGQIVVK